jgi:glycosyltransferase involved in cell wall biosynthesis
VKVLHIQYANPGAYPPLQHNARILADKGCYVLVLGITSPGTESLHFSQHPRIEVRRLGWCPAGLGQKLHFLVFGLWSLGWTLWWRPKWLYVSDELASPVGLALSFLPDLRVVYHEHDSPVIQSRKPKAKSRHQSTEANSRFQFSKSQLFILWCRKRLARRAAFCVLPNEKRIEIFKEQTGTTKAVLCVWNCPGREEAAKAKAESATGKKQSDAKSHSTQPAATFPASHVEKAIKAGGQKSGDPLPVTRQWSRLTLFYHGSIVPARVPLTVLQAVGRLPGNVRFQMAGYETINNRGYVSKLQAEAARLGIGGRFEYLGAFPREALLPLCQEADVGLSLMPTETDDINQQTMPGASNKPFDYLACGLPLLVSDLPDWRKMFVEPGYGLACNPDDPQSITQGLLWFIEHPEEARQMGERGRQKILQDWNYEAQFEMIMERL